MRYTNIISLIQRWKARNALKFPKSFFQISKYFLQLRKLWCRRSGSFALHFKSTALTLFFCITNELYSMNKFWLVLFEMCSIPSLKCSSCKFSKNRSISCLCSAALINTDIHFIYKHISFAQVTIKRQFLPKSLLQLCQINANFTDSK